MTLLTEPTRIVLAKGYSLPDDADAVAYIAAVEAADGQALETATRMAINSFVKGCKNDGIWPAIKASCILSGARTLTGALVPLVGAAPTNFNFVAGDYDRKTGVLGSGGKSINSNRNNNADPQDNNHNAVWLGLNAGSIGSQYLAAGLASAGGNLLQRQAGPTFITQNRSSATASTSLLTGFLGMSRSSSADYSRRVGGTTTTVTQASATPFNGNIVLFNGSSSNLTFYSIGESLDLALLDTRVTTLINAFAAAIP